MESELVGLASLVQSPAVIAIHSDLPNKSCTTIST